MSRNNKSPNVVDHNKILDTVYDSAITPEHFNVFLSAWDETFTDNEYEKTASSLQESAAMLSRHFSRADKIFQTAFHRAEKPISDIVNRQPTSAFICDAKGTVQVVNQGASDNFDLAKGDSIYALPFDSKAACQLNNILKQRQLPENTKLESLALRSINSSAEYHQSLVLLVQSIKVTNQKNALFLFKSSLATWHSGIEQVLYSAFELTRAEIEIVRLLNGGLSLKEIAEQRHRSLDTIRTQIKNILHKTDTQNQTNLMRHVTSLLLVAHSLASDQARVESFDQSIEAQILHTESGREVRYRDFGNKEHHAVLLFVPVLPKVPNINTLDALIGANLRVIVIEENNQSVSSFVKDTNAYDAMFEDYAVVIDTLGIEQVTALGHCAGGIYAVEFAKRYPDRVSHVICVDTGAPLHNKHQWERMGKTARRTFLVAKQFPSLLLLPHRLTARDYFSGEKGQQKVIDYFYGDWPNDLNIINQHKPIRKWVEEMLEHNFEDIKRPIRACEMWVQDWTDLLIYTASHTPISFVHGDANQQFLIDDIQKLTRQFNNINVVIAEGASQLTMATHIDEIVNAIIEPFFIEDGSIKKNASQ